MKEIIIAIISSSVIGGTIVALLNWYRAERTVRKEHKINYLDEQIRNLYGRLYYLISQNERMFSLYNRYHVAYNEHYGELRGWNESIKKEAKLTLEIGNKYIHEIENNNQKIKDILDTNSSLIDYDDVEYQRN